MLALRAEVMFSPALSSGQTQQERKHIVRWQDRSAADIGGWQWELSLQDVKHPLATGGSLTLRLGFDLMWYSEYFLLVEVVDDTRRKARATSVEGASSWTRRFQNSRSSAIISKGPFQLASKLVRRKGPEQT